LAAPLKLIFDDRVPLQLMLNAVGKDNGAAAALERETGTRLHVRGNEVTIEGPQGALVERLLRQIYALARSGKPVDPSDVSRALEVLRQDAAADLREVFEDVVIERVTDGKGVMPRSLAQKRYVEALRRHTLTFGIGPAGTGKTFLAVAVAARMLAEKQVRRVILSRPAIEAGERLGFLPGTLEEKISPYLRPLYDALHDMLPADKVLRMLEQSTIEIAPLAYMRGRTLNDAFVILDEAQNTTKEQMKMFLTRIGQNTRAVVTGDPSQVDLPSGQRSGLQHALRVLQGVDGIAVCRFTRQDVMRHPLVQAIVDAYDRDWRRSKQRSEGGPGGDRPADRAGEGEASGGDDAPPDGTPAS
jgi:phosphate starvation-inducible PhoH-like protein